MKNNTSNVSKKALSVTSAEFKANKKAEQTRAKSKRQKERRAEKKVIRDATFLKLNLLKGNAPRFGVRAATKLKSDKIYAWHIELKFRGNLDPESANMRAIKDFYESRESKFGKKPRGGAITIYPYLANQTPEHMATVPPGDVRTNAEIYTQYLLAMFVDRGAENIEVKGLFVSRVMGGGKGL